MDDAVADGLVRPAVTLFLLWFGLIAYRLGREAAPGPRRGTTKPLC